MPTFFKGLHSQFKKEKKEDLVDLGLPYDVKSVMQYGSWTYKTLSKFAGPVMTTLDGKTFPSGVSLPFNLC